MRARNGVIMRGVCGRVVIVGICLTGLVAVSGCGGSGSSSAAFTAATTKTESSPATTTTSKESAQETSEKQKADFRFFKAGGGYVASYEYGLTRGMGAARLGEVEAEGAIEDVERMVAKGNAAEAEEIAHDLLASGWLSPGLEAQFQHQAEAALAGEVG